MKKGITAVGRYVGLDVHAETVAVAVAERDGLWGQSGHAGAPVGSAVAAIYHVYARGVKRSMQDSGFRIGTFPA